MATSVPAAVPTPEQQAESAEALARIVTAIRGLPPAQRDAVILFYVKAYSQREIAAFLELPVTTVNNRLHAARRTLRGELAAMMKDEFDKHRLPDDFAARIGQIIRARGPLVEASFDPNALPPVFDLLTLEQPGHAAPVAIVVAQHIDATTIRGVMLAEDEHVTIGAPIAHGGGPVTTPIGACRLPDVLAGLSERATTSSIIETGIKAIDLFAPLSSGCLAGLIGDMGAGKMVLVAELLHALAATDQPILCVLAETVAEIPLMQRSFAEAPATTRAIYLPVADAHGPALEGSLPLDATLTFSASYARAGLYPALDPLLTTSRFLTVEIVGEEHVALAAEARSVFQRYHEARVSGGTEASSGLSGEERLVFQRAERLRNFLTQPFFVAEPFTGRVGRRVGRAETLAACRALLDGVYDHLPPEAFLWCGPIEDAIARARAMKQPEA